MAVIRALGWTRPQAAEFIAKTGRMSEHEADSTVDRIAILPGQLTAYDTGGLEFFALRKTAQRELGAAFDIREFHDTVLRHGSVTLPMLREIVERWIADKKAKR